jgi:hypothetical protein
MNFKFLPYQFLQSLPDFIHDLEFKGTQDVADLYKHLKPPDHILGFHIEDVFLYFICHHLIASLITLNCHSSYQPQLIKKLSEMIGISPTIKEKHYCWINDTVALYCYQDDENENIRLYYTIKEYDILG